MRALPQRAVVVGTVLVDLLAYFERLPEPGRAANALASSLAPGAGFNILAAASRLGLKVACGSKVGSGPFGRMVQAALEDIGATLLLEPGEKDTGLAIGLVETGSTGQPTFFGVPGVEATLGAADLGRLELKANDVVCVSGYDLWQADTAEALGPWAASLGKAQLLAFDPGPVAGQIPRGRLEAVIARADLLSLNRQEAQDITGEPLALAALAVLGHTLSGQAWVVLRDGANGCLAGDAKGAVWEIGPRPARVVDATGAGDTHLGAMLARLAQGDDVPAAAWWANVAASLSTESMGAAAGPSWARLQGAATALGQPKVRRIR